MRTRYVLTALALPALFAACTNEDFEMQASKSEHPALQGRSTIELTVEATKGNKVDTRVVGDIAENGGINWYWEDARDKLGAVLVDFGERITGTDLREVVDLANYPDYAITNYPFAPNITGMSQGATFSTPTAVRSGAYIFYNRYKGEDVNRGTISTDLDRLIEVSEGEEKGLEQVGTNKALNGQNYFVSPIVSVAIPDGEEGAKIETPLMLKSIYHVLNFKLKADVDDKYLTQEGGFQINKIELSTMGEGDVFHRRLTIDPAKIATIQKNIAMTEEGKGLFLANGAIDAISNGKNEIAKALNLVDAALENPVNKIGDYDKEYDSQDLVYQLDETFKFTKKGQEMTLMVLLPAETYHKGSAKKEYGGRTEGIFHLKIYTSEGTYDEYWLNKDEHTFLRGRMSNVPRTLVIKGGETNINLFDLSKGFKIETTADYKYAIDYIYAHPRDFGEGSKWGVPTLNFANGAEIEVDAKHYFPEFPVKYVGDATLNLVEKEEYVINPENVILAEGKERPTIKVEGQDAASVKFEGNDAVLKLVSDAKVVIADNQTVKFEKLESATALEAGENSVLTVKSAEDVLMNGKNTFANGATVTLESEKNVVLNDATVGNGEKAKLTVDAKNYFTTTGEFNLNANSELSVRNVYTNEADAKIGEKAIVLLAGNAVNEGTISVAVTGKIVANKIFTNAKNLTLEAAEKQMNVSERSKATIATLVNNGMIDIKAGGDKKGTYGGNLTVLKSVTNNAEGEINVDGEFFAKNPATGKNFGAINLLGNPYALIQLNGANFASQNEGAIYLTVPTEYEMFDTYYSEHNELTAVAGDIIAELDAATLAGVWNNHQTYKGKQETAWSVINKVKVKGEVPFETAYTGTGLDSKNIVLQEGSAIKFARINTTLNFANIEVAGNAEMTTEFTGSKLNAKNVTIAKGATLTNGKNVNVTIAEAATTMLDIQGALVNNGAFHTTIAEEKALNTVLGVGAKLTNGTTGTLGSPAKGHVYWSVNDIKNFNAINNAYRAFKNAFVRKNVGSSAEITLTSNQKNWTMFKAWCNVEINADGTWIYNGVKYKVAESESNKTNTVVMPLTSAQVALLKNISDAAYYEDGSKKNFVSTSTKPTEEVWSTVRNTYVKTPGYIQDYIKIETNDRCVLDFTEGSAYGYIVGTKKGTLINDFTENYKTDFGD